MRNATRALLSALFIITSDTYSDEKTLILKQANFERLFTHPETRNKLDTYKRQGKDSLEHLEQIAKASAPPEKSPQEAQIKVIGYIKTQNGQSKVWLDDGGLWSTEAKNNYKLTDGNRIYVEARDNSKLLKPGQTWLLDQKIVRETYQVKPKHNLKENDVLPEAEMLSEIPPTELLEQAQQIKDLQKIVNSGKKNSERLEASN